MVKVIKIKNIDKTPDKLLGYSNLFFHNNMIFIEGNRGKSNPNDYYTGIIRYNVISEKIDHYKFPLQATIISHYGAESTLYYASFDWNLNSVCIQFRKLNCVNFSDKAIISLVIEDKKGITPDNSELVNAELFAVDDRYAIAFIPQINMEYGFPIFSKILLIDSQENKYYIIPDKLGKADSLLRLQSFHTIRLNEQTYIVLKTGRIGWEEKEYFWNGQIENYFDQLESLIIIDSDTFIKKIKDGIEIDESYIIDNCGFYEALILYIIDESEICYGKFNFAEQTSKLLFYNTLSKQSKIMKIDGFYTEIIKAVNGIYGIKTCHNGTKIYNLINNKVIFSIPSKELILDCKGNSVITYLLDLPNFNNKSCPIFLHNIQKNTVEKLGEGIYFYFDHQQQILIII